MAFELTSWVLLIANLTHHINGRAFQFQMAHQLDSSHVLEVRNTTYLTAELRTFLLTMDLELSHSFPNDYFASALVKTPMWKLTEVN